MRAVLFGELQHAQRLLVVGLGTDALVETRDRFHVVVVDVGAGIEDAGDGGEVAVKVRGEHFDASLGESAFNGSDGGGPMMGAAIGEFVAIDGSDDDVAAIEGDGHAGYVFGLVGIDLKLHFERVGLGDGTKAAAARAEVAENHEGGRAAIEAFVDVGAAGGFADRMEVETPEIGFEMGDGFEMGLAVAQPGG